MLTYHTENTGKELLLTVEFKGDREQRNLMRENLAKTIFPDWQFLSYLDCKDQGDMTFFLKRQD